MVLYFLGWHLIWGIPILQSVILASLHEWLLSLTLGFPTRRGLEITKKADAMFDEMGMNYWLGKAQEVLATLFLQTIQARVDSHGINTAAKDSRQCLSVPAKRWNELPTPQEGPQSPAEDCLVTGLTLFFLTRTSDAVTLYTKGLRDAL